MRREATHLPVALARRAVSELILVLDHGAKPPLRGESPRRARGLKRDIAALARKRGSSASFRVSPKRVSRRRRCYPSARHICRHVRTRRLCVAATARVRLVCSYDQGGTTNTARAARSRRARADHYATEGAYDLATFRKDRGGHRGGLGDMTESARAFAREGARVFAVDIDGAA